MAHSINPPPGEKSVPFFYWSSFVLACLGVLDSIYLLVYKLTNNNAMCIGSGGCHDVNFSPYSEIGGIPVSVIGIAGFLFIAAHPGVGKTPQLLKRKWSADHFWSQYFWSGIFCLPHLARTVRNPCHLPILCGFGSHHIPAIYPGHHPAGQTTCTLGGINASHPLPLH